MKALFLTNEFPPHVYGGAGVHVDYLARELSQRIDLEVRCFGDQRVEQRTAGGSLSVTGYGVPAGLVDGALPELQSALGTMGRGIAWAAAPIDADVVHCHTWYAHFGGLLARQLYGTPLVITTHSLEPLRPWKREQLGRGYDLSAWVERTALQMADAVIAVSEGTRQDILQHFAVDPARITVIPNGIDIDEYRAVEEHDALVRHGVPTDRPYVLFVGRITRQKGIVHLLSAIEHMRSGAVVVLCAGAPDTEEIGREMQERVSRLQQTRGNVIWIPEMVERRTAIQLYSHARVFCCPSVYEPFGIINLEAMACGTPVVASAVGGIPEVVQDGATGLLVPYEARRDGSSEPLDPQAFAAGLAAAIDRLVLDEAENARMARAGRQRVEQRFAWSSVASRVLELYRQLTEA